MRRAEISRKTAETEIYLTLDLDGAAEGGIATGVGFLDHMLTLFSRHAGFGLGVRCQGDTWVDGHHTVEDVGLALGEALKSALGDKRGIRRYGDIVLPMDEALILCAVDLSGRPCLRYAAEIPSEKVGDFDTELAREFMQALANSAGMALHLRQLDGENSHHIIEAMFKALGRALSEAAEIVGTEVPSTKGVL